MNSRRDNAGWVSERLQSLIPRGDMDGFARAVEAFSDLEIRRRAGEAAREIVRSSYPLQIAAQRHHQLLVELLDSAAHAVSSSPGGEA